MTPILKSGLEAGCWANLNGLVAVIRHGETAANAANLVVGQIDPPLSEDGARALGAFAQELTEVRFTKVFSSDLARAKATAQSVAALSDTEVVCTFALREADFGHLDGLPRDSREYQNYRQERETDKFNFRPPGGESYRQVADRLRNFLTTIECGSDDKVAIVTHLGPIRIMQTLFCDIPESRAAGLYVDCLSVSVLDFRNWTSDWGVDTEVAKRLLLQ